MCFCRRKSFSKRNRWFPPCVARPSFLLPGSEEMRYELFLLQHHLLQRYEVPCSNSPRLLGMPLVGDRGEASHCCPRGALGASCGCFPPWLSSCAQASRKKIPLGRFQASGHLSCTNPCSSWMKASAGWDPAWLPALPLDSSC